MGDKSEATWHGVVHRPRVEDLGPGRGEMLVCDADDQEWPCEHEYLLALEEPS